MRLVCFEKVAPPPRPRLVPLPAGDGMAFLIGSFPMPNEDARVARSRCLLRIGLPFVAHSFVPLSGPSIHAVRVDQVLPRGAQNKEGLRERGK